MSILRSVKDGRTALKMVVARVVVSGMTSMIDWKVMLARQIISAGWGRSEKKVINVQLKDLIHYLE